MQDIGHDMDDLLRRASELYPLKKGRDNWAEIAARVEAAKKTGGQKEHPEPAQKGGRKSFILLLFLFLLTAPDRFFFRPPNHSRKAVYENKWKEQRAQKGAAGGVNSFITPEAKTKQQERNTINYASFPAAKKNGHKTSAGKRRTGSEGWAGAGNESSTAGRSQNFFIALPEERKPDLLRLAPAVEQISLSRTAFTTGPGRMHTFSLRPLPAAVFSNKRTGRRHGFYYGAAAGLSISTVKNSGLQKPGTAAGLLAGYRCTNRLAVEGGLIVAQKWYNTAGEYFSMEEMESMMPPGMKMMEVEGSSRLLEVPLHLRYNWLTKKEQHFFSTAGVSSFILTREANWYHTMTNGFSEKLYGSYRKNKLYTAATIDLSIGYERTIGTKTKLRLQPYAQVPVQGIGVGRLPVTSGGLRIGILRTAR